MKKTVTISIVFCLSLSFVAYQVVRQLGGERERLDQDATLQAAQDYEAAKFTGSRSGVVRAVKIMPTNDSDRHVRPRSIVHLTFDGGEELILWARLGPGDPKIEFVIGTRYTVHYDFSHRIVRIDANEGQSPH